MNRVLVVDDAAFMRMMIKQVLTRNGYEVVGEADNGASAIIKCKQLRPTIITMDITMPGMSGIEAVKSIREFNQNTNVIMISAMGQESMVKEAIAYGANSFILKPFKEEHLLQALKKIYDKMKR